MNDGMNISYLNVNTVVILVALISSVAMSCGRHCDEVKYENYLKTGDTLIFLNNFDTLDVLVLHSMEFTNRVDTKKVDCCNQATCYIKSLKYDYETYLYSFYFSDGNVLVCDINLAFKESQLFFHGDVNLTQWEDNFLVDPVVIKNDYQTNNIIESASFKLNSGLSSISLKDGTKIKVVKHAKHG